MEKLKKKYGLWTGIAMVVGIVVGSGVFVKAGGVLETAGGDLKFSLLAWFVGGSVMIVSAFCFAIFATKVSKFNGVIDYVESVSNKRVGYHLAWVMTTLYYPIVASIVALIAGSYLFSLLGLNYGIASYQNLIVAFVLITFFAILNYLAPRLSSRFQVSATIIKLVPILVIAFIGLLASFILESDVGITNAFTVLGTRADGSAYPLQFGEAVKKTSFAYEGWVCATAINAELKDSKKNLPRALVGGTIAILIFYLLYYLSLSALLGNSATIMAGANAPLEAFTKFMGSFGSKIFIAFIIVSCLGTVNGVAISCCRGMYTMSCRGLGPAPKQFAKLNPKCQTSFLSSLFGYFMMCLLLLVWYAALNGFGLFKYLSSMDEIICAIIYAIYITMYVYIMRNFKELNPLKRYVLPTLAILGSLFFTLCGSGLYQLIFDGSAESLKAFGVFLILLAITSLPSLFFYRKEARNTVEIISEEV